MPTRDEVLRDLLARVADLEEQVRKLNAGDAWDEELDLGDTPEFTTEAEHVPAPLRPASGPVKVSARVLEAVGEMEDPDEDTPEVIEARRRIEQANAEDLQPRLHQFEVRVDPTMEGANVTVPSPTPEQSARRQQFVGEIAANLPGLEPEMAEAAYLEGGPVWLYSYDRHHVVNLPDPLKVEMVNDVAETMPETAHEMARDLFKVTDPDIQSAWAHDKMETVRNQVESGLMGPDA